MGVSLLSHEVSDLCLGKPSLRSLPLTTTISQALIELKSSRDNFLSIWSCDHTTKSHQNPETPDQDQEKHHHLDGVNKCKCVGKICMVDVICYLCKDENLLSPCVALQAPVSVLLPHVSGLVMHVEPTSSLLEAIDLILQGAQNLVVPIKRRQGFSKRTKQHQKLTPSQTLFSTNHNGQEFCCLTQEDIIRYLLSSIGLFSPLPTLSIDTLGLITTSILSIDYHSPASSVLPAISSSLAAQTSVAVVDGSGEGDGEEEGIVLIGEISPFNLSCCDETVAAAIATLSSAGDLMAYIDCGGPPEDIVKVVMARLKERGLEAALKEFACASYPNNGSFCSSLSSSSDEEYSGSSPISSLRSGSGRGKYCRSMSYSARMVRRAEAIVCHRKSSLVAVMIQAISHRVNYVWVIEEDCSLVGIVTFCNMLRVFREHLVAMAY